MNKETLKRAKEIEKEMKEKCSMLRIVKEENEPKVYFIYNNAGYPESVSLSKKHIHVLRELIEKELEELEKEFESL